MNLPSGYSIASYGDMITDPSRGDGYVPALRKAVFPGCTVLDIGAGPGIFALLACQLGARHVYAVEPDASIELARQLAKVNGFEGRIDFFRDISTKIELPETVDLIVSDLRGVLPLFQNHLPSIMDARQRHLAAGGKMIPARDTLWAALVENPKQYRPCVEPWVTNELGLDLLAGHKFTVSKWSRTDRETGTLLSEPRQWAEIDYYSLTSPNVAGDLSWTAHRSGIAHGLLVWFDSELFDGISYTNRPDRVPLIYGQAFFPLERPVSISEGDVVECTIAANLIEGDYIWRWNTRIIDGKAGVEKADFRQSNFDSVPLSIDALRRHHPEFVPARTETHEIDCRILTMIDGSTSLETVAQSLYMSYPRRYARWQDALTYVIDVLSRYETGIS